MYVEAVRLTEGRWLQRHCNAQASEDVTGWVSCLPTHSQCIALIRNRKLSTSYTCLGTRSTEERQDTTAIVDMQYLLYEM